MTHLATAARYAHTYGLAEAVMHCVEALNTNQPYGGAAYSANVEGQEWATCPIPQSTCTLGLQPHRKGYRVRVSEGVCKVGESVGALPMDEARKHMLLKPA